MNERIVGIMDYIKKNYLSWSFWWLCLRESGWPATSSSWFRLYTASHSLYTSGPNHTHLILFWQNTCRVFRIPSCTLSLCWELWRSHLAAICRREIGHRSLGKHNYTWTPCTYKTKGSDYLELQGFPNRTPVSQTVKPCLISTHWWLGR